MFDSIVRYTNDSAGLEKTLRLVQAICTVMAGMSTSSTDIDVWLQARSQVNLGMLLACDLAWREANIKCAS
jgi:hypothetical protein